MNKNIIKFIGIYLIGIGIIMIMFHYLSGIGCETRWKDSGLKSTYSFNGGCRVNTKDNIWIPENNIREIDINSEKTKV